MKIGIVVGNNVADDMDTNFAMGDVTQSSYDVIKLKTDAWSKQRFGVLLRTG